jgi:hypothetical protein
MWSAFLGEFLLGQSLTVSENVIQLDASERLKPTAAQRNALNYKMVAR